MMHPDLDRADLRILDLVQQHGHFSAAEVAERLRMTASTCWRRISRLEQLGVIVKRVALLDREKLGLSVMVFSHVKVAAHRSEEHTSELQSQSNLVCRLLLEKNKSI